MKEVLLSEYGGRFNLPNEVELYLLKDKEAFHLFESSNIDNCNFAPSVIKECIRNERKDFAGMYDNEWGYFNFFIINIGKNKIYDVCLDIRNGHRRDEPNLIEAVKKYQCKDFRIENVEDDFEYSIYKDARGEQIIPSKRGNFPN